MIITESAIKSIFDAAAVVELVRRLSTPFEKTKAFQLGLIDKDGKPLKPRSKMSREEKQAFTLFDLLIFNIKKLMAKTTGSSNFTPFVASMLLLREEIESFHESEIELIAENIYNEAQPSSYSLFLESEAPVNVSAAEPNPTSGPKNIEYPDVLMSPGLRFLRRKDPKVSYNQSLFRKRRKRLEEGLLTIEMDAETFDQIVSRIQ